MKPTEEQKIEFWEKYGFRWIKNEAYRAEGYWLSPDGNVNYSHTSSSAGFPTLDLNNLFKYAVPKLQEEGITVDLYGYENKSFAANLVSIFPVDATGFCPSIGGAVDDDPALALFWALWKVRGEMPLTVKV